MNGKMKVFWVAIVFVGLVSLACESLTPTPRQGATETWKVILSNTPHPTLTPRLTYTPYTPRPTNTPRPTYSAAQMAATLAAGFAAVPTEPAVLVSNYTKTTCEMDVPERFTSMRCYWISKQWTAMAIVFYSGNDISGLDVSYSEDAPQDIVEKCAQFIIDFATLGGWNMSDVSGAMESVASAKEQGWTKYNTISAKRTWSDYGYWSMLFYREP